VTVITDTRNIKIQELCSFYFSAEIITFYENYIQYKLEIIWPHQGKSS